MKIKLAVMKKSLHINNLLHKKFALSLEDAEKMYSVVEASIKNDEEVSLSFKDIENCSTIFLNNFLGLLYSNYKEKVERFVHYVDVDDEVLSGKLESLRKRAIHQDVYKPIFLKHISH